MREFIYYFLCVILSILMGISMIINNKFIFLICLSLLIFTLIKSKRRIISILIIFMSFISITNYYSVKDQKFALKKFRVVNKISKDIIVKSSNIFSKKYLIRDFGDSEIKNGMNLILSGEINELNFYDIGVVGEISNYTIENFEFDFIYRFINMKDNIKKFFVDSFGKERGNVLSSLTFGDTSELNKEYKNNLKSLGLIHILSVSGFHMNFIFLIVSRFLNLMPSILISFIYLLFTGAKTSGVRAFIMMFLKEMAPRVYKTYDGINALCFAGVFILLIKPYEIFNMGFIYSFAAALGILVFNRRIANYFYKLPNILSDSLSLVLSSQVFILPINILIERKFGIGFILSNILLVPFYSVLMLLGILFILFGIFPIIKGLIIFLTKIIFSIIDGGILFVKFITPDDFYLSNYVIIFILCLYVIYFANRKIGYDRIKRIPIFMFGICFLFMNLFDLNIEIGKYFDKNYVIVRNRFKNYMYIDRKINDPSMLEEKLGVNRVFQDTGGEEFKFYGNRFLINFEDEKIFLKFNDKFIEVDNNRHFRKYYSDIYPNKFYIVF